MGCTPLMILGVAKIDKSYLFYKQCGVFVQYLVFIYHLLFYYSVKVERFKEDERDV